MKRPKHITVLGWGCTGRIHVGQVGDALVECTFHGEVGGAGATALRLVDIALEVRVHPCTRQTIGHLRKDGPNGGSKIWLLRFVCALLKLLHGILVLAKPMVISETVPDTGVTAAVTKEQHSKLRGNGLVLHRAPALQH